MVDRGERWIRSRRGGREVLRPDRLAAGHDGRMLDRVAQLSDVAGPGPVAELVQDVAGQRACRHVRQAGLPQEVFGQGRDVVAALAQRGKVDLKDAEAEEQVFAEFAGRHQRSRGGGWSPR